MATAEAIREAPVGDGRREPAAQEGQFVRWRLAMYALSLLDLGANAVCLFGSWSHGPWSWIVIRAVVAGLAVASAYRFLPALPGNEGGSLLVALTSWCITLPVFGPLAGVAATSPGRSPSTIASTDTWSRWPLPVRWDDPALRVAPPTRHDAPEVLAGELMLIGRAHDGQRLRALLRATRLPLRFQIPLARHALADPHEDVRLYAFSLLERRRTEHERTRQRAADAATKDAARLDRAAAHLRLAEVTWEGAYHGLYEGSGLREALLTALEQVDQCLTLHPSDASAHILRGRVLLRLGRPELAGAALQQATSFGAPPSKVLSYLAEGAFQRRAFDEVRDHITRLRLVEMKDGPVPGGLRLVMEQWL